MRYAFCLLLLFILVDTFAQEARFTKKQLAEDIHFLNHQLELIHPARYHFTDSSTQHQSYLQLRDQLPEAMNTLEFQQHLMPLINTIKCGHTKIFAPASIGRFMSTYWKRKVKGPLFPFNITAMENRVIVRHNLSTDTTILKPGATLITINGDSVTHILHELQTMLRTGADGDNQTGVDYYNLHYFKTRMAQWYAQPDSFVVEFLPLAKDQPQTVTIGALPLKTIQTNTARYFPAKKDNIQLGFPDKVASTAVMRIQTLFQKKDPFQWRFKRKLKRHFREISTRNTQHLIIDIRGNGGGALSNTTALLKYLMPHKFRYNKEATINPNIYKNPKVGLGKKIRFGLTFTKKNPAGRPSFRRMAKYHKPRKKDHFDGQLYILMDGGSYSASALLLSVMRNAEQAVLVGEEAGGNAFVSFAGLWQIITLPNSKIDVLIPFMKLQYDVKPFQDSRKGILPQYTIQQKYSDYLLEEDTALNFIFDLIENQ